MEDHKDAVCMAMDGQKKAKTLPSVRTPQMFDSLCFSLFFCSVSVQDALPEVDAGGLDVAGLGGQVEAVPG